MSDISQQLIFMWIVKIVGIGGVEHAIAHEWSNDLYKIAQRQLTPNTGFVISHLEAIYFQLAQGKTVDDVKEYIQQVGNYYQ